MDRKKILLTDDVELFLMLEKTIYNRKEFGFITARSGHDILKLVKKEEPDLVFMNLNMPDIDGEECCSKIKGDEKSRNLPIVLMVPENLKIDLGKFNQSGYDDILYKPINRKAFLAITRKYLNVMERVEDRFNARVRIKYRVMTNEDHYNYSIDINTGGLFLEMENPLKIDTPLDLEFQLPASSSIIKCKARGAWVNDPRELIKPDLPGGMGVQFLDISAVDKIAITDYINNKNLFH